MSTPVPEYGDDSTLVPLTLRIPRGVRTKLGIIAGLLGESTTGLGRRVIEAYVANAANNPELQTKAGQATAAAQRAREEQERAIADLFGTVTPVAPPATNPTVEPPPSPETPPGTSPDQNDIPSEEPSDSPTQQAEAPESPAPEQGDEPATRSGGRRGRTGRG